MPIIIVAMGTILLCTGQVTGLPTRVPGGVLLLIGVIVLAVRRVEQRLEQQQSKIARISNYLEAEYLVRHAVPDDATTNPPAQGRHRHPGEPRRYGHLTVHDGFKGFAAAPIALLGWTAHQLRENATAAVSVATVAGLGIGAGPSLIDAIQQAPSEITEELPAITRPADGIGGGSAGDTPDLNDAVPVSTADNKPSPTPAAAPTAPPIATPTAPAGTPTPTPSQAPSLESTVVPTEVLTQLPDAGDPDRFTGRDQSPPCHVSDLTDKLPKWLTNGGDDSECS
jgi:hypothetical protein